MEFKNTTGAVGQPLLHFSLVENETKEEKQVAVKSTQSISVWASVCVSVCVCMCVSVRTIV